MNQQTWRPGPGATAATLLLLAVAGTSACSDQSDPAAPSTAPAISTAAGGRPHATPTRGRIAFSHNVSGNFEIYTIAEDGSGLRRITYNGGTDQYPTWSPDGRKLAFVRNWMTESEIFVINADGTGEKQVTKMGELTALARDLAWSPDGRTIAFAAAPTGVGSLDIYVVQSNGSGFSRLTSTEGDDQHPAWTPDGKRLAYSSLGGNPAQQPEIYSMDRQGSNVLVETECAAGCYSPAWSPDGTRLAYNEQNTIKVKDTATSYVWTFAADAAGAAWSPDAVRLVYTPTTIQGTIMVINADMSDPVPLVAFVNSLAGEDADWGR